MTQDSGDPAQTRPLPPHAGRDAALALLETPPRTHHIQTLTLDRDRTATPDHHPAVRIFLATPYAPDGAVLYMLDGNAAFDFLTPAHLERYPGLLVAGVGYDTEKQFARAARIYDYSPPPEREDPHHPGRMAGGAAAHLARMIGPVRAAVETGRAIDPARRTLWGHSFGGLFTLYAMAQRAEGFSRYAAISPSIWWDTPLVTSIMAQSIAQGRLSGRELYLGVGDAEKRTASPGPPPDGPPPATLALWAQLEAATQPADQTPPLRIRREIYPGAVHIAALPASIPATLALAAK